MCGCMANKRSEVRSQNSEWRGSIAFMALIALPAMAQQGTMHITLAEAERLAAQNNPALAAAKYMAAAAGQVPAEYRASYSPSFSGSVTGVGADNGSRLAAGG